jgi:sugar transferase EpsL
LKRVFDVVGSLGLFVLLSPLMASIALLVLLVLGRPLFFVQLRVGLGGRTFELYKFRSMTDSRDANGMLLPDSARMTLFGRFLRRSSLDELPELWNVARGDMSLVGPRPLLPEYLPLYSREQARRHEVRPGITGWAQVNGRNAATWEQRFAWDVWYVEHCSFGLDIRILLMTIGVIFSGSGVSQAGHVTVEKFRGNR